jgi:hypothetical protein
VQVTHVDKLNGRQKNALNAHGCTAVTAPSIMSESALNAGPSCGFILFFQSADFISCLYEFAELNFDCTDFLFFGFECIIFFNEEYFFDAIDKLTNNETLFALVPVYDDDFFSHHAHHLENLS